MIIGLGKINESENEHIVIYCFFQSKNSFCYIFKLLLQSEFKFKIKWAFILNKKNFRKILNAILKTW